jgi:hypothetical protein
MNTLWAVAGLVVLLLTGCSDKQPINERFPTSWSTIEGEERTLITEALAANDIKDCGELYIKRNPKEEEEYLLACTKDGQAWRYYYMDLEYTKEMEEAEEDDYAVLKAPNRDSLQVNGPKQ